MARKKVLITVTTYPLPSRSYDELVCTAGILEDGSWIRIYPVPLEFLKGLKKDGKLQSFKYTWIELDLKKRSDDFRPESHSPMSYSFKDMEVHEKIGTEKEWAFRKKFCLNDVYTSMDALIAESKDPTNKSLATFKPTQILGLDIEKEDREWKKEWLDQFKQLQFSFDPKENEEQRKPIAKLPYKFLYRFIDSDGKTRRLMIEDWEIGALFWNCMKNTDGDEKAALEQVKKKYVDEFLSSKDIHFFLGTTKEWHMRRSKNPFVIIGVFYPPKPKVTAQLRLFGNFI